MAEMIARGRAGKGCSNCHKRRIKCDFRRPECSQCTRAQKPCPGYPDPNAIIIRDQSEEVIRKSRALEKSRHSSKSPFQIFMLEESSSRRNAKSCKMPSASSLTSTESEGIRFFFATYAVDHMESTAGEEEISHSVLWSQACDNKALNSAINALGLAGLSNVKHSKEIMAAARTAYSAALRHTMSAVEKISEAQMDSTLKAILILSLFEVVTSTEFPPLNWGDHMEGAVALLQLRDIKHIVGNGGTRLFLQIYFVTAIHCLHKNKQLPANIEQLASLCQDAGSKRDYPAIILATIAFQFVELNYSIKKEKTTDPITNIYKAIVIETELERWRSNLPPEWHFDEVEAKNPDPRIFRGRCHLYQNPWISRVWNHYRWIRILIHELILDHLVKITTPTDIDILTQRRSSLAVVSEVATEVFYSVPIHSSPQFSNFFTQRPFPRISGVFVLLWPLAVAAKSSGISKETTDWVISLLRDIGENVGINQALAIADSLRVDQISMATRVLIPEKLDIAGVPSLGNHSILKS